MLSDCAFLISVASGMALFLATRIRHPYTKALMCMILGTALVSPVVVDVRLVSVSCVICVALAATSKNYYTIIPAVASVVLCIVMCLTPDANNQLYLQLRYADTFTHIYDNVYHSRSLDKDIVVDRRYGDTYQYEMWESLIVRDVLYALPPDTTVHDIRVERVQTNRLFDGYGSFVAAVNPTVRLVITLDEEHEDADLSDIPFNTTVELIS